MDMAQEQAPQGKPIIRLSAPEELLAAVPGLLGYVPANSVVMLAVGPRSRRVTKCARGDLPPPEHAESVARQIGDVMAEGRPSFVDTVVVGGGKPSAEGPLPAIALVAAVRRALTERGVEQPRAYWVSEMAKGGRWRSYDDPELGGDLPDPSGTQLAAELAAIGQVTFGSRAELEALFRPDAEALLEQRSELIDAKIDELAKWTAEKGIAAVRQALRMSETGLLALSDEQVADLAIALAHSRVRDACLATALPPEAPLAQSAARVWQALSRALPVPDRAEAACLAAFAAYQQGDGSLARIALDVALEANPSHVLAGLLDRALTHGVHPHELRGLARHDEVGLCAQLRAAA